MRDIKSQLRQVYDLNAITVEEVLKLQLYDPRGEVIESICAQIHERARDAALKVAAKHSRTPDGARSIVRQAGINLGRRVTPHRFGQEKRA